MFQDVQLIRGTLRENIALSTPAAGHAEIEAIKRVDPRLWPQAAAMTCYSSLEPCLMCFGTLLLHGVGRIVFAAWDEEGGASCVIPHLPPYYPATAPVPAWEGPYLQELCHPLYLRARERFVDLPCGGSGHEMPSKKKDQPER